MKAGLTSSVGRPRGSSSSRPSASAPIGRLPVGDSPSAPAGGGICVALASEKHLLPAVSGGGRSDAGEGRLGGARVLSVAIFQVCVDPRPPRRGGQAVDLRDSDRRLSQDRLVDVAVSRGVRAVSLSDLRVPDSHGSPPVSLLDAADGAQGSAAGRLRKRSRSRVRVRPAGRPSSRRVRRAARSDTRCWSTANIAVPRKRRSSRVAEPPSDRPHTLQSTTERRGGITPPAAARR